MKQPFWVLVRNRVELLTLDDRWESHQLFPPRSESFNAATRAFECDVVIRRQVAHGRYPGVVVNYCGDRDAVGDELAAIWWWGRPWSVGVSNGGNKP